MSGRRSRYGRAAGVSVGSEDGRKPDGSDPAPRSGRRSGLGNPGECLRALPEWWKARDPGLRATKRSIRAAVLVPGVFALAYFGVGDSQTTLFAVFGSFALLLFADFGGPPRERLRSYLVLFAVGALLITVGTLCSTHPAAAVLGMFVFGFAVLLAGAVSSQAAVGATAALLTFVLPVAVPATAGAVGGRLAGWALAGLFCIPAVLLVWTSRWHDPLRQALATAARAVGRLVGSHGEGRLDAEAFGEARAALEELRTRYESTPYRPAGAGPSDSALCNLVARMEWVGENALVPEEGRSVLAGSGPARSVNRAVALLLEHVGDLLDRPAGEVADAAALLGHSTEELGSALVLARQDAWSQLLAAADSSELSRAEGGALEGSNPLWAVDPTYPTRMLAFAAGMAAELVLGVVAPGDGGGLLHRVRRSLRAELRGAIDALTVRSVWFRNSLRGAVALALAVATVEVTDVRHGFWVVLGTLSVLRSNALGTGATAIRAVAGTVVGFGVGSLVVVALGTRQGPLWAVLPLAVLVAGLAPSAISFAAGQAGFTVAVVIIFNILDPVGADVGLVRVEDVTIGVAVSVVVGALFWPRGAAAELARALGEAYASALAWLADEVGRVGERTGATARGSGREAAIRAAVRLDDAFRQFLAERGAKTVPLPAVTHLVTGSARVRLLALTLETLPGEPSRSAGPLPASVQAVRAEVATDFGADERWFEAFTGALRDRTRPVPAVAPVDRHLRARLLVAFEEARRSQRKDGILVTLRLLWLSDRLVELRDLQEELARSAGRFTRARGLASRKKILS